MPNPNPNPSQRQNAGNKWIFSGDSCKPKASII